MKTILLLISKLRWQLFVSILLALLVAVLMELNQPLFIGYKAIDKSSYLSFVSGMAGILALFCSVSFGFVLFQMQSAKTERLSTYSELKDKLYSFKEWLLSLPSSEDTDICMAMVFQLLMYDIDDLPQKDYGEEYYQYTEALKKGLNEPEKQKFYQHTILYSGYIEQLLSRMGLILVRQICIKLFIDTLAKGLVMIGGMILLLFGAMVSYESGTTIVYVAISFFFSIMLVFLFIEFAHDVYRHQEEEIDYITR